MSGSKQNYTVEEVKEALNKSGGFLTVAAQRLGCHYTTVQNYINRYEELQIEQRHLREKYIDLAESKLVENIRDGKEASIFFFLKCKAKERGYIEKAEAEPTQINISFNVQVAKILERCEAKGINPEKVNQVREMMMQLEDAKVENKF